MTKKAFPFCWNSDKCGNIAATTILSRGKPLNLCDTCAYMFTVGSADALHNVALAQGEEKQVSLWTKLTINELFGKTIRTCDGFCYRVSGHTVNGWSLYNMDWTKHPRIVNVKTEYMLAWFNNHAVTIEGDEENEE